MADRRDRRAGARHRRDGGRLLADRVRGDPVHGHRLPDHPRVLALRHRRGLRQGRREHQGPREERPDDLERGGQPGGQPDPDALDQHLGHRAAAGRRAAVRRRRPARRRARSRTSRWCCSSASPPAPTPRSSWPPRSWPTSRSGSRSRSRCAGGSWPAAPPRAAPGGSRPAGPGRWPAPAAPRRRRGAPRRSPLAERDLPEQAAADVVVESPSSVRPECRAAAAHGRPAARARARSARGRTASPGKRRR